METDADARQPVGIRELLQPAEVRVHLALDHDDDVGIARGRRESPPEAARRARPGEKCEARLRRGGVERGSTLGHREPRDERCARDAAGVPRTSAPIPHPCLHWTNDPNCNASGKYVIAPPRKRRLRAACPPRARSPSEGPAL